MCDSDSDEAAQTRRAEAALAAAIDNMRLKLKLPQSNTELLQQIEAIMHTELKPLGCTVFQRLYERERGKDQDGDAAYERGFTNAIQDFLVVQHGPTPRRKARRIARIAWKDDPAADHRVLNAKSLDEIRMAHRGRPEIYDRDVVLAFADTIARIAGRKKFTTGHHGGGTIADSSRGGPLLRVLVAAIQWAMTNAWAGAAPPGVAPPRVKPEGIIELFKPRR